MIHHIVAAAILACSLPAFASSHWKLVWSDEFDYTGLPDKTKWGYDVGCSGWGNQELENYTREDLDNAKTENGALVITARKEKNGECNYTSARLVTKNKGDWLYGRFEIAAKLPQGKGLWPAIWMLPTDNAYGTWPKSGEIDIMENVGFDPFTIFFTVHTEAYNHTIGTSKGSSTKLDDPHAKFNVYAMEWNKNRIVFFANKDTILTFKNEGTGSKAWPFDKRFHLLLNIAVGGSWGGQKGIDTTVYPQSMIVDYVRVYADDSTGASTVGRTPANNGTPAVTQEKKRLFVRTIDPGILSVRLFSINGKLLSSVNGRSGPPGGAPAITLPRGASIAVIRYGTIERVIPLAAVE
jgi:beta-glucanase (GH16 family)